jgi:hypothetical protein
VCYTPGRASSELDISVSLWNKLSSNCALYQLVELLNRIIIERLINTISFY